MTVRVVVSFSFSPVVKYLGALSVRTSATLVQPYAALVLPKKMSGVSFFLLLRSRHWRYGTPIKGGICVYGQFLCVVFFSPGAWAAALRLRGLALACGVLFCDRTTGLWVLLFYDRWLWDLYCAAQFGCVPYTRKLKAQISLLKS